MSPPEVLIYAELLSNIRQISVIAALPTPSDKKTTMALSPNRQQIVLQRGSQTTTLKLPGELASNFQLQPVVPGKQELSWRLPLATHPSRSEGQDHEAAWPAGDFDGSAEFTCRTCKAVVVKEGRVKIWKDLPSANWAEMMEFWHCHKPDDEPDGPSDHQGHDHPHSHELDPNASKGYGANSKFIATSGTGFVDISTFLLSDSDCQNLKSIPPPGSATIHQALSCSACHTYIGHIDPIASGNRLYKWRLGLRETKSSSLQTISAIQIYTSQLSSILQSQVTSRLILIPLNFSPSRSTSTNSDSSQDNCHFLSLWVLSPSIRFSATTSSSPPTAQSVSSESPLPFDSTSGVESQSAMKIFYQTVSTQEAEELMNKEGVEEVLLPQEAIMEIKHALEESRKWLPPSVRNFRGWYVGLLERFENGGER